MRNATPLSPRRSTNVAISLTDGHQPCQLVTRYPSLNCPMTLNPPTS